MAISSIKALIPQVIGPVFLRIKGVKLKSVSRSVWKSKKWLMKPFVKSYLKKQQAQFVADIKKAPGGI